MGRYTKNIYILIMVLFLGIITSFVLSLYPPLSLKDVLIKEKLSDFNVHLEIIAERIAHNYELGIEMSENNQREKLIRSLEGLDDSPFTFGAVYEYRDKRFTIASEHTAAYDESQFAPLPSLEFRNEVLSKLHYRNETYNYEFWFENDNIEGRIVYLSYRWVPQDYIDGEVAFLMVTGITENSLEYEVPFNFYVIEGFKMVFHAVIAFLVLLQVQKMEREKFLSVCERRGGI